MARWPSVGFCSISECWRVRTVWAVGVLASVLLACALAGWHSLSLSQPAQATRQISVPQPAQSAPGPIELAAGTLNVKVAEGQRAVRTVALENTSTDYATWAIANQGTTKVAAAPAPSTAALRTHARSLEHRRHLQQQLADEGRVRVIVELDGEYESEKRLSRAAVRAQRRRIATVQERVLSDIEAHTSAVWASDHMPLVTLEVDEAGLQRLFDRPDVVRVIEDRADPLHLETSTQIVGADDAWDQGIRGGGQAVVVLDAGISSEHPFLDDAVVHEACFSTESTTRDTESLCPDGTSRQVGEGVACNNGLGRCGHGTHVAGIVAGQGQGRSGAAPAADIIAVQVFSRFNNEASCDGQPPCYLSFRSDQIRALEYAYELRNQYDIASVNMSLGGGEKSGYCSADPRKSIVRDLRLNGIATVASSGNDGRSTVVAAPACLSETIAVGASQSGIEGATTDRVSAFSNSAWTLNFLAPGQNIESSTHSSGFQSYSGTSMAAPHVAGAWALMRSRWPGASVSEIQARLDAAGLFVTDDRNGIVRPRLEVGAALADDRPIIAGPTYGTVPPTGREEITIVVDGASMSVGTHQRTVAIVEGNGEREELFVNVEVVTSTPARAQIEPRALSGDTRTGEALEIAQQISNTATNMGEILRVDPDLPPYLTKDRVLGEGVVATDTTIRIRPQTTATIVYRFEETAEAYTVYEDSIRLHTNDPALGTVSVPTRVAVRVPRIAVEPSVVDFGVVPSGRPSRSAVTVTNVGTASFSARSLVGEGGEQFSITENSGTVSLPPGESRELQISSEAQRDDIRKGVLEISHDAVNVDSPIEVRLQSAPDELILRHPYPNPVRSRTTFEYSIPEPAHVYVDVYDVLGRRVARLRDREEDAGIHRVQWGGRSTNGGRVAAGAYFVRIRAGSAARTQKLTVVR